MAKTVPLTVARFASAAESAAKGSVVVVVSPNTVFSGFFVGMGVGESLLEITVRRYGGDETKRFKLGPTSAHSFVFLETPDGVEVAPPQLALV